MSIRTLRGFVVAILLLALAASSVRADTVNVVTSLGGLGANDTIVWSTIGADAFQLPASQGFMSTQGLTGTAVLSGPNSLIAVVCPETLCSWNPLSTTGFVAGDSLLWTADTGNSGNGPLTVNFTSKNVAGAGAFIQADGPGQFTAQIEAFNGGTPLGTFPVMSDVAGDATFIGVLDSTGANITSVEFSITSCTGDCSDFAIDTVSLNVPTGGTPTPTSTSTSGTPTPTPTPTARATATAAPTMTATPTPTPTPVPATLKITPPSKNFGAIKVGHFKKQTFTLSNTAKSGPPIMFANPISFSVTPVTNPQEFGFPPNFTTCTALLFPKKKCKLIVEFLPANTGPRTPSTLTIFDNATGAPQTVQLNGSGK